MKFKHRDKPVNECPAQVLLSSAIMFVICLHRISFAVFFYLCILAIFSASSSGFNVTISRSHSR